MEVLQTALGTEASSSGDQSMHERLARALKKNLMPSTLLFNLRQHLRQIQTKAAQESVFNFQLNMKLLRRLVGYEI